MIADGRGSSQMRPTPATPTWNGAVASTALPVRIADPLPLDRIAEAHDRVAAGTHDRVLLRIPD